MKIATDTTLGISMNHEVIQILFQPGFQLITKRPNTARVQLHGLLAKLTSFAKAYNSWDIERARTNPLFVSPAK